MSTISLTYRALGAAALDRGTYEGIEHDRSATAQAVGVVLASSLAAGIGASGWNRPEPLVLLVVSVVALVTWLAWVSIIFHLGGRYFAERQTHVTFGELLRTIGFAASPGMLQVFAVVPELTEPVFVASWIWMLAAMTVAVRQALDFKSIGRALVVCGTALLLVLGLSFVVAMAYGPVVRSLW